MRVRLRHYPHRTSTMPRRIVLFIAVLGWKFYVRLIPAPPRLIYKIKEPL